MAVCLWSLCEDLSVCPLDCTTVAEGLDIKPHVSYIGWMTVLSFCSVFVLLFHYCLSCRNDYHAPASDPFLFLWLRIPDEGLIPEMRIRSIF